MYFHHFFLQKNDVLSSYDRQKIARYKKIISYMEAHYSENVTLDQLAEIAGCNSQYLCRFFKEITGIPPMKYLIQYGLNRHVKCCVILLRPGLRSVWIADLITSIILFGNLKN